MSKILPFKVIEQQTVVEITFKYVPLQCEGGSGLKFFAKVFVDLWNISAVPCFYFTVAWSVNCFLSVPLGVVLT